MQIVSNSSDVYEISFQTRDLLPGFEGQNNKLNTWHGHRRHITEEKDLADEASRDCLGTSDCHQLLPWLHAKPCFKDTP